MDIKSLQMFLHLTDSLHFGKSAEALHVSPSTLSRTVQRLEEELGVTLFQRDNRSVSLTSQGNELKSFAQQQLEQWNDLKLTFNQSRRQLEGKLQLYCSVTAAYSHLPPILDKFRLAHPKVELILATGDPAQAIKQVQQNEVDFAIAANPGSLSHRLNFISLAEIPLVMIAPTVSCAVQQQVSLLPIPWNEIPFILAEHGPAKRRIDNWYRQMQISKPNIYAKVTGHEALVSMVALGCGVGIAPEVVIENSPVGDRVQKLTSPYPIEPFNLGICCQKKRLEEPLIKAFLACLQN